MERTQNNKFSSSKHTYILLIICIAFIMMW